MSPNNTSVSLNENLVGYRFLISLIRPLDVKEWNFNSLLTELESNNTWLTAEATPEKDSQINIRLNVVEILVATWDFYQHKILIHMLIIFLSGLRKETILNSLLFSAAFSSLKPSAHVWIVVVLVRSDGVPVYFHSNIAKIQRKHVDINATHFPLIRKKFDSHMRWNIWCGCMVVGWCLLWDEEYLKNIFRDFSLKIFYSSRSL